ncbi:hypothetical protein [Chlorella virus XW01]|nr:hypothetical protein [Chlorella virus XW01]
MFKYGNPSIQNTQYYLSRNTTYRQIDNISVAIDPEQLLSSIIDNNLLNSALGDDLETQKITTNETETNILNVNEIKGSDDTSIIKFLNDTHFTRKVLFAPPTETFLSVINSGNNFYRIHIKGSKSDDLNSSRGDILIENKFTNIDSERIRFNGVVNYDNFSKNLNYSSNVVNFNRPRFNFNNQPQSSLNSLDANTFGLFSKKIDDNDLGIYISPKFIRTINNIPGIGNTFTYDINIAEDERLGNKPPFDTKPSVKFLNLNFNYNNNINISTNDIFYNFIGKISENNYDNELYLPIEADRINIHSGNIINPNKNGDISMWTLNINNENEYVDFFKFINSSKRITTKSNSFQINDSFGSNIILFNNFDKNISFGSSGNNINNLNIFTSQMLINTNNLLITDSIIKISHNNFNNTDKGIEFNYNNSGNRLGFFGLNKDNNAYKFLINATNNNNNVSGNYAKIEVSEISNPVSDLSINSVGNIILTPNTNKIVVINSNLDLGGNILMNGDININFNNINNVNQIVNDGIIIIDPSNTLIIEGEIVVRNNSIFKESVDIYENLNVLGEFIVDGLTQIKSDLELDGSGHFKSNIEVSGNLIVNGITKLNNNVDILGNLSIQSKLIVESDASFNSNVDISGDLIIQNRLIVESDASFNSNVDISGDLIIQNRLIVESDARFNSNVDISGDLIIQSKLIVESDASFNSNLDISGDLSIQNRLIVESDASFNSNVDISGDLIIQNRLIVENDSKFMKKLDIMGDLYLEGDITIKGTTTTIQSQVVEISDNILVLNSGFVGNPPPTLVSGIRINRGKNINNPDYFFIFTEENNLFKIGTSSNEDGNDDGLQAVATREDFPINNNIAIWDNNTLKFITNRNVTINSDGNMGISGELTVDKKTLLNARIDINEDVSMNSNLEVNNNTLLNSRLDVIGDVSMNSNLEVNNNTLLNSSLDVNGNTALKSRVDITGDVSMNSNLEVNNNTLLKGNLGVGTNPTVKLHVIGESQFTGSDRTSHFNISSTEDTYIRGGKTTSRVLINDNGGNVGIGNPIPDYKLDVSGDVNFSGNFYQNGDIFVASRWDLSGIDINRDIGNVGIGNASPAYKLDVSGDVNFSGNLYQNGDIFVTSRWDLNGIDINRNIGNVGIGNASPAYKLDVSGDVNFSGNLYQNGDIFVASRWDLSGIDINRNIGNVGIGNSSPAYKLDVNGDVNFSGNLYQNGNIFVASRWDLNGSNINRSSGNVGIGKTIPTYKLDVNGDINFSGILYQNGNMFHASRWDLNGSNINRVIGNVGIGTTNPGYKLDILENINGEVGLRINNSSTGSNAFTMLRMQSNNSGLTAFINSPSRWSDGGPNVATIRNDSGDLRLYAGGGSVGIHIKSGSGNIGIGLTDPGQGVHIAKGDSSKILLGPSSTWGGFLEIGSGNNSVSSNKAQINSTDGKLYIDSGGNRILYLNNNSFGSWTYIGPGTPMHFIHMRCNQSIANGIMISGYGNDSAAGTQLSENLMNLIGQNQNNNMNFYWRGGNSVKYGANLNGSFNVFTGQHLSYSDTISTKNIKDLIGLIVVSKGKVKTLDKDNYKLYDKLILSKPTINNAHPVIELSSISYQKSVYGVITDSADDKTQTNTAENRVYKDYELDNTGFYNDLHGRIRINSLGEGCIWVTNENGLIENGDYITTSSIEGYGMKQNDDILHSYTVAKSTVDCDFISRKNKRLKIKHEIILDDTGAKTNKIIYDENGITQFEVVKLSDLRNLLENEEDIDVEDDEFEMRYFYNNIQINFDMYLELIQNESNLINIKIACLIPCTYHCG